MAEDSQVSESAGSGKKLSIVIPAYNEEARIEAVLRNYCESFPTQEIIVVCNGCTDNTPNIAGDLCASYSQIRALAFEEKMGKGGAIVEGFRVARGDVVGFVDADESVEPGDVERMLDALANADGIIASRRLRDSRILVKQPLKRRLASRLFNLIVRVMFGLSYRDTQCGAKVFRKDAVHSVQDELTTKGFEFDVELLWKLKKRGYNVVEFPVTWKHSEGSTFRLSNAPRMFLSLLKVRLWS